MIENFLPSQHFCLANCQKFAEHNCTWSEFLIRVKLCKIIKPSYMRKRPATDLGGVRVWLKVPLKVLNIIMFWGSKGGEFETILSNTLTISLWVWGES